LEKEEMGFLDRLAQIARPDNATDMPPIQDRVVEAAQLLELGMALEEQGRPDEALLRYEAALGLQPTLARAHFNKGNILLDRGAAEDALTAYSMALQYKPDSAGTHYNIGNAQLRLANPVAAAAAYREALRLRPDFPDAQTALEAALAMGAEAAEDAFRQGLAAEDLGQLERAATSYRQTLAIQPDHVYACNNLGGLLLRQGQAAEATLCFRQAAEAAPGDGSILLNLGSALQAQGLREEALVCYERALEIMPASVPALIRQGIVRSDLGQRAAAAASYRRALEIEPDNPQANLNLCSVLIELGQLDPAEASCRRLLAIEPGNAGAHSNLGVILKKRRQLDEAVACFRRALAIQPDLASAHVNLGSALHGLGQLDDAAACYLRALEIQPDSAVAHSNYGNVLQDLDRFGLAEKSFLRALEIDPGLAMAHNNLALVYSYTRRLDDSVARFRRAIELDPDYADAYANLAGVLKDLGRMDDALHALRRALEIDRYCLVAHNNLLFIQNYMAEQPGEQLLADARRFGEVAARLARPYADWPNPPDAQRPLRVGLVSGDLCNHPVGYFLEGVLTALASQASGRLEVFAYSNRLAEDETSQRLRACCRGWCSCIGLTDEALARRIRDDGIDILIDLAGHTAHNRLAMFAWKPAPVQVSWLGYFATTGVAAIDYFLADPWTLPPDQEAFFAEQVWRLPETRLCFTPPNSKVEVNALPALANGYITFGCFNNLSKMNDAVVQLWARVLQAVPGSRLFLKYQQLAEASVRQRTCERFAVHGIDAARLIFEDYAPRADYLAAYHRVDIALDPFPFPGGTTTVEALWMGVPVLTLQGERFLARQGVGLLMNAGLPEWVAADAEDYVARAATHANDLQALAALRARLRQQVLASPIYDAPRFAQHFEAALRSMWLRWCQGASGRVAQH